MPTILSNYLKNQIVLGLGPSSTNFSSSARVTSIHFYSGAQPLNPQAVATGTLLGTITIASSNYATAISGVAILNANLSANAVASGAIGYARISGAGGVLFDTTVTLAGGGGGAIVANLTTTAGQPIILTNLTITQAGTLGNIELNVTLRNTIANWITGRETSSIQIVLGHSIYLHSAKPTTFNNPSTLLWSVTGQDTATTAVGNSWSIPAQTANASATGTIAYGVLKGRTAEANALACEAIFKVSNISGQGDLLLSSLSTVSGQSLTIPANALTLLYG